MGIFGEAAIRAKRLIVESGLSPAQAWDRAIAQLTDSPSTRSKYCPRGAFLGLCASGLVSGIPAGAGGINDTSKNGQYAVAAWKLLQSRPALSNEKTNLWAALRGVPERENGQMDVAIGLWNEQKPKDK